MEAALEGIKVLDLTTYLGGAAVSMYLGDFGAEVVKVEPPEGDRVRAMRTNAFLGKNSPPYMVLNRNKKGIVLDLTKPQGKEIALKLAKGSDVIVEDHKPGIIEGLGLGYEAVRAINARIIYCSIPPFGKTGPYSDLAPNDLIVKGMTGLMMKPEPGPYTTMDWLLGELPVGVLAAHGIAMALLVREETGVGQLIETSCLSAMWPQLHYLSTLPLRDPVPPRAPPGVAWTYCYYQTKDGAFAVTTFTERHWERLCKICGFEDLLNDKATYGSQAKRNDMKETLRTVFAAKYREWTTEETLKKHIEAGVPCSEVNRWWQLFDHPQFREQGFFAKVEHPAVGETEILGCPMSMTETPSSIRSPAPTLGQHTEEVLAGLGYSPAQIEELRRQGVVQGALPSKMG